MFLLKTTVIKKNGQATAPLPFWENAIILRLWSPEYVSYHTTLQYFIQTYLSTNYCKVFVLHNSYGTNLPFNNPTVVYFEVLAYVSGLYLVRIYLY